MSVPHDARDDDDERDAFIDLADPNVEVLDETRLPEVTSASDEEGDERDDKVAAKPAEAAVAAAAHAQDEDDEEQQQQQPVATDLNEVPDHEPERDDAMATFRAPDAQPLHTVVVHPTQPDLLATAGEGEVVYILQLDGDSTSSASATRSVHLLHTLTAHTDTVSLLAFSPNGEWLASAGLDGLVCLWRTEDWACVHKLGELCGEILTLLWHPSSLVLVAGADDAQAAMWNVLRGTLIMYYVGHRGPVVRAVWSPDHKKLVTGSADGTVLVYNPRTGAQEASVNKDLSPDNAGVTALRFVTADQCVVGCEDGTLHVLSLRAGRVASHLDELHDQAIESLEVNDNRTLLLSSSCDCRVVVWSVGDLAPRVALQVGESVIPALWLGLYGIVAGCSDGTVRVWDGRSSEQAPRQTCCGHRRMVLSLAACSSSVGQGEITAPHLVLSASDDGTLRVFSIDPVLLH